MSTQFLVKVDDPCPPAVSDCVAKKLLFSNAYGLKSNLTRKLSTTVFVQLSFFLWIVATQPEEVEKQKKSKNIQPIMKNGKKEKSSNFQKKDDFPEKGFDPDVILKNFPNFFRKTFLW